jgi:hypothetical protein
MAQSTCWVIWEELMDRGVNMLPRSRSRRDRGPMANLPPEQTAAEWMTSAAITLGIATGALVFALMRGGTALTKPLARARRGYRCRLENRERGRRGPA